MTGWPDDVAESEEEAEAKAAAAERDRRGGGYARPRAVTATATAGPDRVAPRRQGQRLGPGPVRPCARAPWM